MRIGNLSITLTKPKEPVLGERGATGTVAYMGRFVEDEYNPDLRGDKALKVYDQMRRSDGQVKAALLACELPLRQAEWQVKPASGSQQDRQIAEFIRRNLFQTMTITWDDFLRHVLLFYPFGFSVFEKVWEQVDGKSMGTDSGTKYRWRKLAPRLPKSIHEWKLDEEGGLAGVKQLTWKGSAYETVDIPVVKLLVFSLGREGSNYEGISLLRAAYKHWYLKDVLYKLDAMAAERHGVGLPYFKVPVMADDASWNNVSAIGESLHAHERQYVALGSDYEFDLKGVSGQLHDIMRSVEHHDLQIARSILAQFLNLGSQEVGSYALSQDQTSFFLMSLRAVGRNICNTINRYAIRQIVDYNWGPDTEAPQLTVTGLEVRNITEWEKAVLDMVTAGVILPDKALEAEARRILRLPPATVEMAQALRMAEPRALRGAENYVAFKEIGQRLDTAEEAFVKAAKEVQERQIDKLTDVIGKLVQKGQIDRVPEIDVPFRIQMADAIEQILVDLYGYGREQVKAELSKQKTLKMAAAPLGSIEEIGKFLKTRAKATAAVLGSKLKAAITWEALRQVKTGTIDQAVLKAAMTELSDKALKDTASLSVMEALNFGRQAEAEAQRDNIKQAIYSSVLDPNTCPACQKLDGQEWLMDEPEVAKYANGNPDCEGHDRCRCVLVYVYKGEK